MKVNTSVTNLDLSGNEISDDGVKVIAEALKENTSVTNLYLRGNKISDDGAKSLIHKEIEINKTLYQHSQEDKPFYLNTSEKEAKYSVNHLCNMFWYNDECTKVALSFINNLKKELSDSLIKDIFKHQKDFLILQDELFYQGTPQVQDAIFYESLNCTDLDNISCCIISKFINIKPSLIIENQSQINDLLSRKEFDFLESTEIKDFIESQPYTDNTYWELNNYPIIGSLDVEMNQDF